MKTKEVTKSTWPKIKHTINPDLNQYEGKTLFPEKLAKANETIKRIGLPKGWGKS